MHKKSMANVSKNLTQKNRLKSVKLIQKLSMKNSPPILGTGKAWSTKQPVKKCANTITRKIVTKVTCLKVNWKQLVPLNLFNSADWILSLKKRKMMISIY